MPIQCEFLALEGLGQLITTIDLRQARAQPAARRAGVLMTMFDARTRLSAHVVEEVRRYFPHRIFGTVVPRSVRLAEAPSYGQAIVEYDPSSRGAEAYEAFVGELHRPVFSLPTPGVSPAASRSAEAERNPMTITESRRELTV